MGKRREPSARGHHQSLAAADFNAMVWRDFVLWAFGEPDILRAFRDSTGIDLGEHASPLGGLVDEATGKTRADLNRFVDFVTAEIWGADDDPRGVSR